ncbi:hypothetical protein Clacol_009966 [Clathrus columnatus]|uniref:SET domain-containing protein n=1 Tax=Clathrus columnatus TaxID=1419009 RepID=A0AAV5ASQ2_9AGAM|nr:hypothetical protein Clacol_009966 [Clathrus columnatus]
MSTSGKLYFSAALALGISIILFQLYGRGWPFGLDVPLDIVNVEGRGRGLIATRDLPQGYLILKENPLFVIQAEDLGRRLPSTLSNLDKTDREAFFQLSFPSDIPNSDIPEAILRTNGVSIRSNETAIFRLLSRVNHGCSHATNSVLSWRDNHAVLYAIRPIKKGEEIFREYVPSKFSRKVRRDNLEALYGFRCNCPVCLLSPVETEKSDIRLSSIATIEAELYDRNKLGKEEADPKELVRLAKRVWGLGETEGYWVGRGRLAEEVSTIAAAYHDSDACRQWARLSAEWYGYELGRDSNQTLRMIQISLNPTSHPYWGESRKKTEIGGPDE